MKKRTIILVFLFSLPLIYLMVNLVSFVSKLEYIEQPEDYKNLIKNDVLKHINTIKFEEEIPFSTYIKDLDYGLIIFKKKIVNQPKIKIKNASSSNSHLSIGSIFTDYLDYSFIKNEEINDIVINIDGYKEKFLIKKSDSLFYLSFPINKNAGIKFNDNSEYNLFAKQNPNISKEINELMVLIKNDYVYFIYLKPFKSKAVKQGQLTDLINL